MEYAAVMDLVLHDAGCMAPVCVCEWCVCVCVYRYDCDREIVCMCECVCVGCIGRWGIVREREREKRGQ